MSETSTGELATATCHNSLRKGQKTHKRHKRTRKAVVEGKKISNVDRQTVYRSTAAAADTGDQHSHDDYVLRRLIKNSGVHSAMLHENIMQSANPDYLLVECEAEKVARDAAEALRLSRQQCLSNATLGTPTWTGTNGANPSTHRARFGRKKNAALMSGLDSSEQSASRPPKRSYSVEVTTTFDGSALLKQSRLQKSRSSIASSAELLAHMRSQNTLISLSSSSNTDNTVTVPEPGTALPIEPQIADLLRDIRDFVATGALVDGQASTSEILDHFRTRVAAELTAKFKSLLKQVCTLQKVDGIGIWKLRTDFQ